jgi:hypothetical protein
MIEASNEIDKTVPCMLCIFAKYTLRNFNNWFPETGNEVQSSSLRPGLCPAQSKDETSAFFIKQFSIFKNHASEQRKDMAAVIENFYFKRRSVP